MISVMGISAKEQPLPRRLGTRGMPGKWRGLVPQIRKLKPGRSLFVTAEDGINPKVTANRIRASLNDVLAKEFHCVVEDGGVRIWRRER